MHEYHQDQDRQQIEREQRYCDVIGNQAEQRRHQAGTDREASGWQRQYTELIT